ncbi:MAG: GDP-mannose 4,6-dehydratase [Verrucomicrobia bacterium]|nr:GDP-mannose 4,6-dehydratase [Verrucomicrobiota bacterium]
MSRCLVTGCAGFIGSHLSEALLKKGHDVVGLDAFIPYYDRSIKARNLTGPQSSTSFTFHEKDLRTAELHSVVKDCDVIFHEAAMPGLVKSWSDFDLYSTCNELGTLRLLEAARDAKVSHFIYISTSSVYGKEATGPEDTPLQPFSPYGISKLAAENLCRAFEENFDLPITVLRYFSVYGPRQRPDMAYNILIRGLLEGRTFTMCGDGEQTRSNTFVSDCVNATILAFEKRDVSLGGTFNIGGGQVVSLNEVVQLLEDLTGRKALIERAPARPGDQRHTCANIERAKAILGYSPAIPVREGLQAQVTWQKSMMQDA